MILQVYNLVWTLFLVLSIPYLLWRSLIRRPLWKGLRDRMGFLPRMAERRPLWVHASSVGEVFCVLPLVKRIKAEFPEIPVVLSTMTPTGKEAAQKSLSEVEHFFYLPLDHPLFIRLAVRRLSPRLLLLTETELWPNLLTIASRKGVPIVLFNGRISEKSLRGYLLLRSLFRKALGSGPLLLMQSEADRNRIVSIGAPFQKTRVTGNVKFDQSLSVLTETEQMALFRSLGLTGNETLLIAGSTHPGEEESLLWVYKTLKGNDPDLFLLLAPRHLRRLEEVEALLERKGLRWVRRSAPASDQGSGETDGRGRPGIILLDTLGELKRLYALGTLVFIGGSLVPVGGHNPLEPLCFKKCVLFGPHMFNFAEISRALVEAGGAMVVEGEEDLLSQMTRLLSQERERVEMGERGYQFLMRHQGATERVFREIKPLLGQERG